MAIALNVVLQSGLNSAVRSSDNCWARLRGNWLSGNVLSKSCREDDLGLNAAVKIAAPEHQCAAIVSILFELLCGCSDFRFNRGTRAESARGSYSGVVELLYFK